MPIARWCAVVLCLFPVAPAVAQSGTKAAPTPPVTTQDGTAGGQASSPAIVVTGRPERKKGDWIRAEGEHVVVTSNGSEAELTRVTNNLERLYQLMSRIYRKGAQADETVKLQVTLFDSADFFHAMGLRNLRSEEGPYAAGFADRRYYDPREDGEVLAVARTDQLIDLDTHEARNSACDDVLAAGAEDADCNKLPPILPVTRDWEATLYSAFAQHFILTYVPTAYPRWYIDGIGALFSTIKARKDGALDYATAPFAYTQLFRSYGGLRVEDVLTGRYLDPAASKMQWTPYHAWAIAHFFLFSELKPERSKQFAQYMNAISQGMPMAEAAKVFGDMDKLQHEIAIYMDKPTSYARTAPSPVIGGDPLISTLSPSNAAMIETRIELGTRPDADRLAQIRARVAQLPYDADTMLVAAEAECRGGQPHECLADAEWVLAKSPDNVRALAWKGVALTDQAVAGPAADRPATLATARQTIARASQLDDHAPLPLIALFQSYTKVGERVPEPAMLGMAKVIRYVPAAPGPRLYLAEELVRQGNADVARRLLYPVLYGPDDSPEKSAAAALFPAAGGALPAGH